MAEHCERYQEEPADVGYFSPVGHLWHVLELCSFQHVTLLCPFRRGTVLCPFRVTTLHLLHDCLFRGESGAWQWLQAAEHVPGLPEAPPGLLKYVWNRGNRHRSGG